MTPEQGLQILDRLGIAASDLPLVMEAAQAVTSASDVQQQPAQPGAPGQPQQPQADGSAGGYRSQLHGHPGASNPIPNQPAPPSPDEAAMREIFASDRNRRAAAY